ncbi:MAG TPA: 5-oxoprolinase subunit PxpB [Candidatus Limnocylindrales bacterium]|jgi:KipI family sensor histidine kinase inhibitor
MADRRGSSRDAVEVVPFGDAAVLVILGDRAGDPLSRAAQAAATAIDGRRASTPGLARAVPAHASVLVPFDPLVLERDAAIALVRDAATAAVRSRSSDRATDGADRTIDIPVRYGGDDGPDLDDVAARLDLRPADVIELHASARYRVLFLGFGPGFAYLGGLPDRLVTPRRATPRERVAAGSVAIAGEHSAVYPLSMPGGWNLIGRTDAVLFDPTSPQPARLAPGASVRFVPAG